MAFRLRAGFVYEFKRCCTRLISATAKKKKKKNSSNAASQAMMTQHVNKCRRKRTASEKTLRMHISAVITLLLRFHNSEAAWPCVIAAVIHNTGFDGRMKDN